MTRLEQPRNAQRDGRASLHLYVGRFAAFLAIMAWPAASQWSDRDPKSMGRLWKKCKEFTCPAGLRRVQRRDFRVYAHNWCVDISNWTEWRHPEWDPDEIWKWRQQLVPCCFERDICIHMCGMSLWHCHREYHICMERVCKWDEDVNKMPHPECTAVGHTNSFHSDITFSVEKGDLRCRNFTNAQAEACECVEERREGDAVKSAMVDFYKQWNPDKLTKNKKDLKEKHLLREWKGKRADMFHNLWKTYRRTAVEVRDRWTHEVIDPKELHKWKKKNFRMVRPEEDPSEDLKAQSMGLTNNSESNSSKEAKYDKYAEPPPKKPVEESYDLDAESDTPQGEL
mmetsp:Transcript_105486/g.191830  ORF Transcript_105486/g.191830 Transcript_105486/m.191830 type:complete len:340 (-) Transcript_105486:94-1113(-)